MLLPPILWPLHNQFLQRFVGDCCHLFSLWPSRINHPQKVWQMLFFPLWLHWLTSLKMNGYIILFRMRKVKAFPYRLNHLPISRWYVYWALNRPCITPLKSTSVGHWMLFVTRLIEWKSANEEKLFLLSKWFNNSWFAEYWCDMKKEK